MSQTLIGVPGLAFSSGIRLPSDAVGDSGPEPPEPRRRRRVARERQAELRRDSVALPPGPQAVEPSVLAMVTFAPPSPPLRAMAGLAFEEPLPRQ